MADSVSFFVAGVPQPKGIPLTQGKEALVDASDFERLSKCRWHAMRLTCGQWVAVRNSPKDDRGRQHRIYMHRAIMDAPKGMDVDHANHDTLDNRKANLRVCWHAQNMANKRVQDNPKSSKFKGVSWHRTTGKWQARICQNAHRVYLGCYASEKEAADIYDLASSIIFGDFARNNKGEGQ